ncbi:MAG: DNA mismatch repair endonuclease MutL [Firmicutes bacterium]|nr:DNA mismatch repair endonuclease MutL [Bacillota bacterium]
MGRVVVLDEATATRIAAGEVVEGPASVAKELVENALDAGARRVEVDLEEGGRRLVKVADDGVGMDREDARLAFERHATSKLQRPEDLEAIRTYGFRGEALPSIASVARVRLITGQPGAEEGTEVTVEGGRVSFWGPGPARPGTVVWVRDLFFNTPARRESLRSPTAEAARVSETVASLALTAPEVAFTLRNDGEVLWTTPGSGLVEDAAASLFGAGFVRETVPVALGAGSVRVSGLAGLPSAARRDGRRQYLAVNRRPVSPRLLRAPVEEAYRSLLEVGRTPVFVLHLEMPVGAVDVNVHPTKTFVRFRDHGQVHRTVLAALRTALAGDLFPGRLAGTATSRTTVAPARRGTGTPLPDPGSGLFPEVQSPWPALESLGQVGGTFVVARGPDGLYVIDQHAAHERVAYERLLDSAAEMNSQTLAVPVTVECAPGDEEVFGRALGLLRRFGFEVEPFGGRTLIVRAVPAAVSGTSAEHLVADLMDTVRQTGSGEIEVTQAARRLAACHASVRAGQVLSQAEMQRLLEELAGAREPRTCPHGRPTVLRLSLADLRRAFARGE